MRHILMPQTFLRIHSAALHPNHAHMLVKVYSVMMSTING